MDTTDAGAPQAGASACADGSPRPRGEAAARRARAKRDYVRRAYAIKVAMTQRACRWIEAGRSITDVCREPDMPQRSTFVAWLAAHPELRAMVEAAQARAAELFRPRREYHYWDPAIAAEVLARIEDGRGLREVCAEPDMPVHSTVTRWLNERPDFAEAYRRAREAQADRLFDLAWRIACEADERDVATARLKIQTLKWRVGRLAPRVYGPLKAQEPPGTAAAGEARREVTFYMRHFARSPEGQVVEATGACLGLGPQARAQLQADVAAGRISLARLAELNAEGEAAMDRED